MKIKETLQNQKGYTGHEFDGTHNEECPGYGHGDGIRHANPTDHPTYYNLAKAIYDIYPEAEYILELGCGAGNLSSHYRSINPNNIYVTMDINAVSPTLGLIDPKTHVIGFTDRPFNITNVKTNETIKFDLIVSFEHFEHIPEERLDCFLDNIKNHCHNRTLIIATAAKFSSVIHPTVFSKEKWKEILEKKGFELVEGNVVVDETKPCNFELQNTTELIFQLKDE